MEQLTEIESTEMHATDGRAPAGEGGAASAAGSPYEGLQLLVCELLEENQRLRTRMAQLEQRAARAERGLASATRGTGAFI